MYKYHNNHTDQRPFLLIPIPKVRDWECYVFSKLLFRTLIILFLQVYNNHTLNIVD